MKLDALIIFNIIYAQLTPSIIPKTIYKDNVYIMNAIMKCN